MNSKCNSWQQPYSNLWNSNLNFASPCSVYLYYFIGIQTVANSKTALYFYHSDHLGSASWITDSSGSAIQHLQYLPFGERFVDQRTTNWNTRYTFSAKEKDEESQYSYFGARYYDSELSIFLTVDPMSDKYPSLTPYNYCANNPLILVDPNGEEIWLIGEDGSRVQYKQGMKYEGNDAGIAAKVKSLNQMNNTKNGNTVLTKLSQSENVYSITDKGDCSNNPYFAANDEVNGKAGGQIATQGNNDLSTLSHELFHGYQDEMGQGGSSVHNEVEAYLFQESVGMQALFAGEMTIVSSQLKGDHDAYNHQVNKLLNSYSENTMNTVVELFKGYSGVNARGGSYNNYPLRRANQPNSLIKNFYPLLR